MKIKMKSLVLFTGVLFLMSSAACAQKGNEKSKSSSSSEMKTTIDSVSYFFGTSLGANFVQLGMDEVAIDQVMQGVKDALKDDESALKLSMAEGEMVTRKYIEGIKAKEGEAALAEGKKYLEEKAKEDNIQSTESGILYEVVVMGDGPKPKATDKVRVNYEGKTTDGKVFDSSYERGQPAEFPLNRVIAGWTEILQEMPVGSTWITTLPPSLAYGERGSPPNIGPNEVLIFKIELIDILPPAESK